MGRKLAAALVLLAASRLPFIQHEGKRTAFEEMRSPHFQSSVAAILSRLKLEILKQRASSTNVELRGTATAPWGVPRNFQTAGSSQEESSAKTSEERRSANAAEKEAANPPEQKGGPEWLQRLGFNASEWGAGKDEELADVILRHLGFHKNASSEKSAQPEATAGKEASSEEAELNDDATSEIFAVDSDGDGRVEACGEAELGEQKRGKLDVVKDGYATLKEKVGLQIFQDIADPVIGLYKRAIAKGVCLSHCRG